MSYQSDKNVFFDLDDTVFDHRYAMQSSLVLLAETYNLPMAKFVNAYLNANKHYWSLYELGQSTRDETRYKRMESALTYVEREELDYIKLTEEYFTHYLQNIRFMEDAEPVLSELVKHIKMGIITNGFVDIQRAKFVHTKLERFFDVMIISEEYNILKPHPDIFAEALRKSESTRENTIFVGDSYLTDIVGARNAGWQSIWFNQTKQNTPDGFHEQLSAASWLELGIMLNKWRTEGAL